MDSLRGIPVEYKLDAFSMPSTGTTSCHPKNWLCRSERNSTLDPQAPNSPLVHINGDNAYSPPKYQTRNSWWHPSSIPTTATCLSSKMQKFNPSRPTTLTSLNSTSLATPKANHIPCCNKNLFIKTPFDLRHLTSSFYLYLPLNLSEGTNSTKRGNNTTIPHLQPFLTYQQQKLWLQKWFSLAKQ